MSLYPENPAGQVYQVNSQDTFASAGAPLTVIGSGGGGPVPENLVVSTLKAGSISTPVINVVGSLGQAAVLTIGTNPGFGANSQYVVFNSGGQETVDEGQLTIHKIGILTSVSKPANASGLAVNAFSTVSGAFQPVGCSDLYIYSEANDGTNLAFALEATNAPVSSLNIQAPNVNISSLIGVSSINGVPYTEGGVPQNVFVSSLNFLDNPGFINFPLPSSIASSVTFNMFGEYIDEGAGSYLTVISMNADVVELAGELQFGAAGSIISSQAPTVGFNVPAVSISTLIGVSSINGVNWARISTLAGGP